MKKLSVLLLAGLMALSLGACGSHPSNNSENSEGGSGNNGPVTIEFFWMGRRRGTGELSDSRQSVYGREQKYHGGV